MAVPTLWPAPDAVVFERITADEAALTLVMRCYRDAAPCPCCNQSSTRVHSRYQRRLADLPWHGVPVRLQLQTRRFFCQNPACQQCIFTERLPALAAPYARRTVQLQEAFHWIALALGGRAGARLIQELGLSAQRDSLLRLIRKQPLPVTATPRVLGVDDWAYRRGQRYGTILIDLERHQRVDLLPNRSAETLAQWLREHPGVEIVSRDRAALYAQGIGEGAPQAQQVVDRWHLLKNLRESIERLLGRRHKVLQQAALKATEELRHSAAPDKPDNPENYTEYQTKYQQLRQQNRERRHARYEEVMTLYEQGLAIRTIALRLGMGRHTVRRFVRADTCPERRASRPRRSLLDPFKPYLHRRWEAGCHNAAQLTREISSQGYSGCESYVRHYIGQLRATLPIERQRQHRSHGPRSPAPTVRVETPSPRLASWLLLYPEKCFTQARDKAGVQREQEQRTLRHFLCALCPEIEIAQQLGRRFVQLLKEHRTEELTVWLEEALQSDIPELRTFASGITREKPAIENALVGPWSNGQVEGQVNRLKLVKRQMYGRANFDLLRLRVLANV